jgi:hypothetical protein
MCGQSWRAAGASSPFTTPLSARGGTTSDGERTAVLSVGAYMHGVRRQTRSDCGNNVPGYGLYLNANRLH